MNIATTYLFVPGNRHERFDKAVAAGADVTIFDLEDAVHPNGKDAARVAIASWLAARQLSGQAANVLVRINDAASPYFSADLEWLANLPAGTPLAGLMVPKAEQPAALGGIAEALRRVNPHGVLVALIESAIGVHQADAIATAPGVARLAFGSIDYAVDLGCEHTRDALAYARSRLVLASRVARLPPPVDGVTTALTEETVLADDVAYARELGFAGKLCIHPSQVAGVRAGFRPSAQQADWARRVIEATSSGSHAVQVDGKMVDRPVIELAKRILALTGNQ